MLKKSLTETEEIAFPLFTDAKENMLDIVVIATTFVALLVTFFYAIANKFEFDRRLGYIFAGIYGAFFVSATVIACV
jgi:glycerol uptake facilitator-like aquaporin